MALVSHENVTHASTLPNFLSFIPDFIGVVFGIQLNDLNLEEDKTDFMAIINQWGNEIRIYLRNIERRHLYATITKPSETILAVKGLKLKSRMPIIAVCMHMQETILNV